MKSKKFLCFFAICLVVGIVCMGAGFALGADIKDLYITKKGLQIGDDNAGDVDYNSDNKDDEDDDDNDLTEITGSYVSNEDNLEAFSSISVKITEANFSIILSDHYGIEYSMPKASVPEYEVEDGTLYVETKGYMNDNWKRKIFRFANFENVDNSKYVCIYIPDKMDGDELEINIAGGNIKLDSVNFKNIKVENNFGDFEFGDIKFDKFDADIRFGKIEGLGAYGNDANINAGFGGMEINTIDAEKLDMNCSSGSMIIGDLSGNEGEINCSFGELKVKNVSLNRLNTNNSFGQTTLNNVSSERFDSNVAFGEIDITLKDTKQYNMECNVDFGDVNVSGHSKGGSYVVSENDRSKLLKAKCSFGEIKIY